VKHVFGLILLLLAAAAPAAVEPPLDQAAIRAHIVYLADDALEGRKPGTEGGDKAAHYVAKQLSAAGLLPGAPDGSWYQPVPLIERAPLSVTQAWSGRDGPVQLPPDSVQFTARDAQLKLDRTGVVFAGYGIDRPDQRFADLRGVDVRGKVVLLLSGRPEAVRDAPGLEVRRQAIAQAGAAAVIALTSASDPWEIIRDQLNRGRTVLADDVHAPLEGALAFEAWTILVKAGGEDPDALVKAAGQPGFQAKTLNLSLDIDARSQIRAFDSVNVIGKIVGSDRPDEAVLYLAHWDHLGLCRPAGAPDRICNGAVDNASGVALLIEIARRLKQGPSPRRSLYLVATTAEEIGLYGARMLARHPPVPQGHIAAAINLDTVAIGPAGEPVATIGRGRTSLDPLIDEATRKQDRKIDDSDAVNAFITRQDGWELLKAGIPAVMVGGAFSDAARLATFLAGDYHKPSDDLNHPIPLDGAAEDGALQVVLGRMLADPAKLPLRSMTGH
jgi:hypothetical protein